MKTKAKTFSVNLAAFIFVAIICSSVVFAEGKTGGVGSGIKNPIAASSLSGFFNSIVSVLIELGTIVSVLGIMYGGFLYATAQGDEEKIGKAYKTVTWALVGTAVLLGARTIMAVIAGTVAELGS